MGMPQWGQAGGAPSAMGGFNGGKGGTPLPQMSMQTPLPNGAGTPLPNGGMSGGTPLPNGGMPSGGMPGMNGMANGSSMKPSEDSYGGGGWSHGDDDGPSLQGGSDAQASE